MKKNVLKIILLVVAIFSVSFAFAQVSLSNTGNRTNEIELIGSASVASIYYDQQDAAVVQKAASFLASDIELVTGKKPQVSTLQKKMASNSVIIGTLGQNELIDKLVKEKKLDVSSLVGKWESYLIQIVKNPAPGVKKALVVVGSDRRGTAFGVFSISEIIGVSPWYWWADAPVNKKKTINLVVDRMVSKEPSVKYRGLFINDEDWGLLRWAKNTFETEHKNIGIKTYEKVFELLLRLKANYLCPAMHGASTAFNVLPENKMVADTFAIVMGSVHCEPLLFNNASEWDKKTMGEWDYNTNKAGINKVLSKRVTENAPYENVYTLALRGLHDVAMKGSDNMQERVQLLESALMDQRKMLTDIIGKPGDQIPQAFTPYKEVLDVYNAGLKLPDDVTIIWADDNYGYMKRLSSQTEQKRSGGAGVYYHVSYLGRPHDYLWMGSTSPTFMYEELRKAYDTTADRIWLLNVGDIKSCEFMADYFLSLAYDIDSFNYDNSATYQAEWLSKVFGRQYYDTFLDITTSFYNLAFSRKPEFMGWGYQWNTYKHGRERITDTDFSFANYQEANRRIHEYERIGSLVGDLLKNFDEDKKAGFYQMLYYPVKGAELMNKMALTGQKNRWYAQQGRAATNRLQKDTRMYLDSLNIISNGYNSLLDGKWNHIMTIKQGFAAGYFDLPKLDSIELTTNASLGVWAEGEDIIKGGKSFHSLPAFNTYVRKSYAIDVFNKGNRRMDWSLSVSDNWIKADKTKGSTDTEEKIRISVDWDKVQKGDKVFGAIEISASTGEKERVFVSVFNPQSPSMAEVNGLFIEDNGCISIDAAGFHRKFENDDIKMRIIPNLGFEGTSVQLGDPIAKAQHPGRENGARLEYDFYAFQHGSIDIYTYVLPTFPLTTDRGYAGHEANNLETKYGVGIDDGYVMTPPTSSFEYAQAWYESVLKNCRINKSTLHIAKPGKHTLKILCGDAGTVVQKIVIDFGGMKRSYLGPQPTKVLINQ